MNPFGMALHWRRFFAILPGIAFVLVFALTGCGSVDEAMEEEEFAEPVVTPMAQLEFKVDSLMGENRRLRDQVEAVTSENRILTAKNAELEMRMQEAATAAPAPAPVVAPSADYSSAYEAALAQYNARNYSGALEQFQALLSSGSAGDLAANCQYWVAESYYGLGKYGEALQGFKDVLQYRRSGKIPYAYLMIGNCESVLGNGGAAREAYSKIVSDFPTSPIAGKAQEKLAKLK